MRAIGNPRRSPQASFQSVAPLGPRGTAPRPALRQDEGLLRQEQQTQARAALRVTSTRLKRILELIERRRRAAVIRQQGSLLAVCPRHTLKRGGALSPTCLLAAPCVRGAPDTTHGDQPTCRWRLASETALQRPREQRWQLCTAASCRPSEGVTKPPQRGAHCSEGNLLERRTAATFATLPPRTKRRVQSLVPPRTLLGAPARVSDITASR